MTYKLIIVNTTGSTMKFDLKGVDRAEAMKRAVNYPKDGVYTVALYEGDERIYYAMVD